MGTPGDKTKIGKVVRGESSQLDPEQSTEQTPKSPQTPTTSETSLAYPSTSTTEMGFLQQQRAPFVPPQYESLATFAPISPEKSEQLPFTATSLEQSTIEDYFVQSKSYPGLAENLQKFYSSFPPPKVEKQSKTFPGLGQPGPSGLQTPKSKPTSTDVKVKKEKRDPQETPKKAHECAVCQKTFPNAAKLARHQNIHGGSSPFKCEHCKKTFSSRFKLVRHALIHSDRKPYSCQVCERTFHRKDHLKNHIKVHSPQKKIYVCSKPGCKKEYTSLLSYRKHLALHAAEDGSLECQICFDTFETKEDILYHLKIHAGSRTVKNPNEKKFKCHVCDRRFFTNKDVRRHLVVHTGMRDFLCQFCPQRFGRKDHLVRHIKKSHSKNLPPEARASEESERETETGVMIKSEFPETSEPPETTTVVKSEAAETTLRSTPEQYSSLEFMEGFSESSLLFAPGFEQLNPMSPVQYLPSTSVRPDPELESTFLESLGEDTSAAMQENLPNPADINPQLLEETVLLPDSEIMRLLQETTTRPAEDVEREEEEGKVPLPPFSQTFQSPPPPP